MMRVTPRIIIFILCFPFILRVVYGWLAHGDGCLLFHPLLHLLHVDGLHTRIVGAWLVVIVDEEAGMVCI